MILVRILVEMEVRLLSVAAHQLQRADLVN